MLRRLTLGLFGLACAAAIAACSSGNTNIPSIGGVPGLGPNFSTNTVYLTDTTQNAILLYTPSPGPSASPIFEIGGSNTTMSGPAYLAFDSSARLYVTNYNNATKQSAVLVFQKYATGSVLPFATVPLGTGQQPRGIAMEPNDAGFVVALTTPGGFFTSALNVYSPISNGSTFLNGTIAGSLTGLSTPIGVAVDANKNVYAANSGNGTITVYALPSPSPTPSGSPSPTPSPTPTPSASPSGSPSPSPTPASSNIAPSETITCVPGPGMPSPCMSHPAGLALDSTGNVYVTDPDSGSAPAVYIFTAAQIGCASPPCTLGLTPSRFIAGSNTKLVNPTDVAVDSAGTIYVVDSGTGPNTSMLLIFSPAANGNVAPATAIALPAGSATGLALSP
jgi:sugar lactone lactonase YvrE